MSKKIFYDADARQRLVEGAKELYDAVKTTMGPKGRNVVISKSYGAPTVTHDGVTVAKAVELADNKDDNYGRKVGAELIKQAASKMNDTAGDGTTTVTILTYHLLEEANKLVVAGHNPMHLRNDLEKAKDQVIKALQKSKTKEDIGSKKEKVAQIATISAGSSDIGKLIADVMHEVGQDGVVTVEAGQGLELESTVVEGFTFDRGFISPYMVTDTARMEAVYDKPAILITDKKISSMKEILPIIERLATAGRKNLVVIAEDVDGEALGTLVLNRLKGVFNTVAVKAPAFGDRRTETLQDIAILTGATLVTDNQGYTMESLTPEMLGTARRVIVSKDETTIIEGAGVATDVKDRVQQIQSQAQIATSDFDQENYLKRAAALNGKVAVIKVGGATETEIEEKKFRVDDAVAAVKAALQEGIVPGGGIALLDIVYQQKTANKVQDPGIQMLYRALEMPFRILLENAGLNPDEWLAKIYGSEDGKTAFEPGYGVNVDDPSAQRVLMKDKGIIDPLKVTREAVQNAVSIAGTAMTMGALIVDLPVKESNPAPDMSGMGM